MFARSFCFTRHFACCLGDTLASELGILSKSPPRLITTGKVVPPGTNGGVSVAGTLASVAGGLIMGLTLSVTLFIESSACRQDVISLIQLMGWGALAGLLGSLVSSQFRYQLWRMLILTVLSLTRLWVQRYNAPSSPPSQSVS